MMLFYSFYLINYNCHIKGPRLLRHPLYDTGLWSMTLTYNSLHYNYYQYLCITLQLHVVW